MESSTWGEHAAPPVTVDNGTSAWGKPVNTGSSWEEPGRKISGGSSWGNTAIGQQSQHKSGTSHLQLGKRTFFDSPFLTSFLFVFVFFSNVNISGKQCSVIEFFFLSIFNLIDCFILTF